VLRAADRALGQRWSPEQIVGKFRSQGRVAPSHETSYRPIRRDTRRGGTVYQKPAENRGPKTGVKVQFARILGNCTLTPVTGCVTKLPISGA